MRNLSWIFAVGMSLASPALASIVECEGFLRSRQNPRLTGTYRVGVYVSLPGVYGRGYAELSNQQGEFFSYNTSCITAAGFPGPTSCTEESRDAQKFSVFYSNSRAEVSIIDDSYRTVETLGTLRCR